MSKWRDYLTGGDEPAPVEPVVEEQGDAEVEEKKEETVAPSAGMSVEAVQAMMDRQAEQMTQNFNTLVEGLQTSLAPKQEGPQVNMPSDADIKKALDEGDTEGFLRLQKQKDIAMATAFDARLAAMEQASNERVLAIQERVVETAVPAEYKKEVDGMMDELGIDRSLRSNPKVLELLTLAAKGKNADAEKASALEAAKRQANLEPTGDVANPGRPVGGNEAPAQLFSDDAMSALTSVGRDQESFAKGMGYASWKDYEDATTNLMTAEQVTHRWMKKDKK